MILLLGGNGFVGSAITEELIKQKQDFKILSRKFDFYDIKEELVRRIEKEGAKIVINAAGYTGNPNVDRAEVEREDCLIGNVHLVDIINQACLETGALFCHISSACCYNGFKVLGHFWDEKSALLPRTEFRTEILPIDRLEEMEKERWKKRHSTTLFSEDDGKILGFDEKDEPNFTFKTGGSFYSGSKVWAEELIRGSNPNSYIFRLRIPFTNLNHPKNYLSKLLNYNTLLNTYNSLTNLNDFAAAVIKIILDNWEKGTYHLTNTGYTSTARVVELMEKYREKLGIPADKKFKFFYDNEEFRKTTLAPRSNCIIDNSKALSCGCVLSNVEESIEECLRNWIK